VSRSKRRRLGQNFLADEAVAHRIVSLLRPEPARVLEIGPGRGALTAPLLERFGELVALELDDELIEPLEDRFATSGLTVIHGDGLTADFDDIVGDQRPWQVASNLPYSVGTAILRRLMPKHGVFSRLVVMLQLEVARRVVARPGDGDHGLMALERAAWAEARIAFDVPPRAFRPPPKVCSAVLIVEPRPPSAPADAIEQALVLAGRALTRPRKMLANAVGRAATPDLIEAAGLDPKIRPGHLSLADWLRLADTLND
jgi:16S rRNA (adenine1518-N6/adenine1519-N6)-dimethyltransferase